jgi:hypothetical protein
MVFLYVINIYENRNKHIGEQMNTQLTRIESAMENYHKDWDDTPIYELENAIYESTEEQVNKWVNRMLESNESPKNIKQYVKDTYHIYAENQYSQVLDHVSIACRIHRRQQTQ